MLHTIQSEMIQRLIPIHGEMETRGDEVHARKLMDLIRKLHRREFTIAFCGHFSAGKSTMLNGLFGEDLLPTSPIPTSANVVRLQKGKERVVLTLRSGKRQIFHGTYTDQELKRLCKNGDEVIGLRVFRNHAPFPEGVSLLDTPGIDSTDEDHRAATESALHLADVIFFVMDYNHVQSEGNLQFVKELKNRGKTVFPVINQIDKHRDEELSFEAYQKSVEQSFQHWEIPVDGIYYTSLHRPEHPFNQFRELKERIGEMIRDREARMEESARREARYLIREHLALMGERNREMIRGWVNGGDPNLPEDSESLEGKRESLIQERESLIQKRENMEKLFRSGLEEILQHAYLMPYEVRESARSFLETVLTDFKVGFFFSKAKTEKEKERRFQAFVDQLKRTVETQLDLHVRQYAIRFLQQHGVDAETWSGTIYGAESLLDPVMVKHAVKDGAGWTGNYLLKYTEDLADAIKDSYRRQALEWFAAFSKTVNREMDDRLASLQKQIDRVEEQLDLCRRIEGLDQEQRAYETRLQDLFTGKTVPQNGASDPVWERLAEEEGELVSVEGWARVAGDGPMAHETGPDGDSLSADNRSPERPPEESADPVEPVLWYVRHAERTVADLPGLESLHRELAEKRARLEQRCFTVALFGAFSAGKSSFANALIGRKWLPVSPNPTTATINRICPPSGEHGHGDAVIHFKTEEQLFRELKRVYRLFREDVESMEEALQGIDRLLAMPNPGSRQKTVMPFLRAIREGIDSLSGRWGTDLTLDAETFGRYVADETRSCFVESADLYVEGPLTEKGIILVDTPGADSLHARHTDLAFRYIKKADAILFVTYYNHPFSRADREFLIQLGRVKDTFAMDKMFFIINAADLADSEEELREVRNYIRDQLLLYGIRHPRLFPVSSLLALNEKEGAGSSGSIPGQAGSGMETFERSFTSFLRKDLTRVSLYGLKRDVERAERMTRELLKTVRQGNEEKRRRKEAWEKERALLLQTIQDHNAPLVEQELDREIGELLYYVKQRLFLRYNDVFIEIFHPSVLREDQGDIKKQLRSCVLELVDFLQHDLMQELRATFLRMEKWIDTKLSVHGEAMAAACKRINGELPLYAETEVDHALPDPAPPFQDLSVESFKKAMGTFKNSKSFFEQNGKKQMRDGMKKVLEPAVEVYLTEQEKRLREHYRKQWRDALQQVKNRMQQDCRRYIDSMLRILSEPADVTVLENAASELQKTMWEMDATLEQGFASVPRETTEWTT